MTAVITRILLRVLAGILMGYGADDAIGDLLRGDPDIYTFASMGVEFVLGALIWAGTEVFYFLAKRFGWST